MNKSDLQKNLFKRVEEALLYTTRFASYDQSVLVDITDRTGLEKTVFDMLMRTRSA